MQNSKNQLTLSKPDSFGTDNNRPLKSDIRLIKSQIKEIAKAGTNSRGMLYQGVRLWGKIMDTKITMGKDYGYSVFERSSTK